MSTTATAASTTPSGRTIKKGVVMIEVSNGKDAKPGTGPGNGPGQPPPPRN
jgi:hypothetical protein